MPDRLPSLIVLVAFWIPPAVAGWVAAGSLLRSTRSDRAGLTYAGLVTGVVVYAAAWFFPGAGALILPGSAIACALAFRRRLRTMRGALRRA